jgi:hypothetical protein
MSGTPPLPAIAPAPMPAHLATVCTERPDAALVALLDFNVALLTQARTVVQAHLDPGRPPFMAHAGPHLRHVIEHHEALLGAAAEGLVDYDARARERAVERDPAVADARLARLQALLRAPDPRLDLARVVRVRQCVGPDGTAELLTDSSFGRELAFVASHAVHHFALLRPYCAEHSIEVDTDFGLAPSTIAHLRRA